MKTKSRHILIIDDSPEDRADVRRMLLLGSEQRYVFSEAAGGAAGLRECRDRLAEPLDCVLLDYHLPDMDALEILAELRGTADLPPLPIVVLTGSATGCGAEVLRAGAQDYIGKGWTTPQSLTRAVDNAIERFALLMEKTQAAKELRDSEARFRGTFENAAIGLAHVALDGTWLRANQALCDIIGYSEEELRARTFIEVTHPDDLVAELANMKRALAGEIATYAMEKRYLRKDGKVAWVTLTRALLRNEAGGPEYFIAAVEDISTKKADAEQLRISEASERARREELETLMDAIPAAVFIAHDATCQKMTGNRATAGMLRLEAGANPSRSAPEDERPTFETWSEGRLVPADELPIQRAAATGEPVIGAEVDVRFSDGGILNLFGSALPLFDDQGAVRGAIGAFLDVTEQKRAEAAMRESEAHFRAIVASSSDAIVTTDDTGRYLSANPAAARVFGLPPEQIIGRRIEEFMEQGFDFEAVWDEFKKQGTFGGEHHFVRGDGVVIEADSYGTANILPGRHLSVIRDITERKRIERELQLLNRELESRVGERTAELEAAVRKLGVEIAEGERLRAEVVRITEEERQRVAADLHDGVCQSIMGIRIFSRLLADKLTCDGHPTAAEARRIEEGLDKTYKDTRQLARGINPVVAHGNGLAQALRHLAKTTTTLFRIRCLFRCPQPVAVDDPNTANQLYRIAQEAIHNAFRHGRATCITLTLGETGTETVLKIGDNGRGLPADVSSGGGMGLRLMRYRAATIAGKVTIQARRRGGTEVICQCVRKPTAP